MSDASGKSSRSAAIRRVTCASLALCVLGAAPASFAQPAGAANCDKPISPSIPEQGISKRLERQLKREMREFLGETGVYLACVRDAYRVGAADNAPESRLLGLIGENNATVKQVDELAAIYEERIGPIEDVVPRSRSRSGQRDPWAGRPWSGTDPNRFPPPLVMPPGLAN